MILMLSVRLAAATHAYLDVYAPTNILIRTLRDPRRRRLAFPVSAVLTVAYGLIGAWLTSIIDSGGPAWLNPLALLCAWNTIKFAWLAVISSPMILAPVIRSLARRSSGVAAIPRASHQTFRKHSRSALPGPKPPTVAQSTGDRAETAVLRRIGG